MATTRSRASRASSSRFTRRTPVAIAVGLALAAGAPLAQAAAPLPGALLGNEFQINSHTAGDQKAPVVAADAAGDFVVVWTDTSGADGDDYGIFAQRFDKSGAPLGSEIQVNTTMAGKQDAPAIAMDADGDFVVAWVDYNGGGPDIFAQRYDKEGTQLGGETFINATTAGGQTEPVVAMDAAGDFVVAWLGPDADGNGIFAQLYGKDGTQLGGEIPVNTTTADNQSSPAVAMDAAGNFIVAWTGPDTSDNGIFAQRYDKSGARLGLEMPVNTATANNQFDPTVAMDATGDFVVAWTSATKYISDVIAKRYDKNGNALGGEFPVNITSDGQRAPSVTMDTVGNFVVTWTNTSGIDGDGSGIVARRYDSSGTPLTDGILVNTTTAGGQDAPAVAMDAAGDFVAVWEDKYSSDGDGDGIFAQRYTRESSLDLKSTLAVAPADTVESGGDVTLTAGIDNLEIPSTLTGNAIIDAALTTATGLTATLTLPDGVTFGKAAGTGWICPAAPVDHKLTCTYAAALAAASATENLVVDITAPDAGGAKLAFGNAVFGGQPDAAADNNSATAGVTVQTPPADTGDNDAGGDSGNVSKPPASSSSGGGGAFGWLGLMALALLGRRRRD